MAAAHHLTFVEELVLLALDDNTGAPLPVPQLAFSLAIAGALISDLALLNRIDSDPQSLFVINPEPTGDPILDPALSSIVGAKQTLPVSRWLTAFSEESRRYEAAATQRLIDRGILRRAEKKLLWVFKLRRYPTVDNQERTEVRTRLGALILGNDLPDPRDATLLGLLEACNVADFIFSAPEFKARQERRAQIARTDLIGREVATTFAVTHALRTAMPFGS